MILPMVCRLRVDVVAGRWLGEVQVPGRVA
jgi:hypothetical protein